MVLGFRALGLQGYSQGLDSKLEYLQTRPETTPESFVVVGSFGDP